MLSIRASDFGDLGNSRVLGKMREAGWPGQPAGGWGRGPHERWDVGLHAPARISPATRSIRIRIQIVGRSAESDGSGRFESSPSKLESRAYASQSACAPRYPNSTGWPIGHVRPE